MESKKSFFTEIDKFESLKGFFSSRKLAHISLSLSVDFHVDFTSNSVIIKFHVLIK